MEVVIPGIVSNRIGMSLNVKLVKTIKQKKMKTKPFDLKQAKAGAKVVTRDGRPARIICWDAVGKYPIIALLDCGKEGEIPYNYTTHGTTVIGCVTSDYDLLLVDETPDELTEFEQAVESICLTMQAGGKIDDIHT